MTEPLSIISAKHARLGADDGRLLQPWFAIRWLIAYNTLLIARTESQPAQVVDLVAPLVLCSARSTRERRGRQEERKQTMDARNVRIGETGLDQLLQWVRQTGKPQTIEALTEKYLEILKSMVGQENA